MLFYYNVWLLAKPNRSRQILVSVSISNEKKQKYNSYRSGLGLEFCNTSQAQSGQSLKE